jgi:flagellar motor switch/type III secretory pathway protein FliN
VTVTTPRPFPWHTLEPYCRADIEAWHHVRRWAETALQLADALSALEAAIGTRLDLRLRDAHRRAASPPLAGGIAIDLETIGSAKGGVRLEVEAPLATALTARALKRTPPRIHAPMDRASAESLAGSLAALVSVIARRTHAVPLHVRTAGPSAAVRAFAQGSSESVDTATFTVLVDDEAYLAQVSLLASSATTHERTWNREHLQRLGSTPIGIPIVATTFVATLAEISSLLEGDAWILGDAPRLRSLRGEVGLAAPDATFGVGAELVDDGSLVLRGGREELGDSPMSEHDENDALVDAVGDVPLVVRVEVGTVRMTAREWAALAPGDVIDIARRIGDPVTLRVSGVEVARGELVDVEGNVGVRVLSRLGEEHAR